MPLYVLISIVQLTSMSKRIYKITVNITFKSCSFYESNSRNTHDLPSIQQGWHVFDYQGSYFCKDFDVTFNWMYILH